MSITQCNYPGCDCGNQFKHEVDNRIDKGFNVYQTYFDIGENDGGGQLATTTEPSFWISTENARASSYNDEYGSSFDASKSIDGDDSSYWCAKNGDMPQWVSYDLGAKQKFNRIEMLLHDTNTQYGIKVYGTNDAAVWESDASTGWTEIHTETLNVQTNKNVAVDFDEVEYQYLKIEFSSVSGGHWAAVHETEVYLCEGTEEVSADMLSGEKCKASSYNTNGSSAWPEENSMDNDTSTYWCATSGEGQWIGYDLGSVQTFNQVAMLLYDINTEYKISLYGTSDTAVWENGSSDSWTKISTETLNVETDRNVVLSFDDVEYRYLKIAFDSISDEHWAAAYEVNVYYHQVQKGENLMNGVSAQASSTNADNYPTSPDGLTAQHAVDGDSSTYWCAKGGDFPQWIAYDLGSKQTFNHLVMELHDDNVTYGVTIYGTNDSEVYGGTGDWTEITTKSLAVWDDTTVAVDFANVEYQYVKITFNSITGEHWAALHETELYYTEETDGEDLIGVAPYNAKSVSNHRNNPEKTVDGNENNVRANSSDDNYWCASSGEFPQWLTYDLGSKQTFNQVRLLLLDGVDAKYSVSIMGTNDAAVYADGDSKSWETICTETLDVQGDYDVNVDFNDSEYRYLKVEFTDISDGSWAAVCEVEVCRVVGVRQPVTENLLQGYGKYDLINPQTFTDKVDKMFDYLADNGMVIALGLGVHSHTANGMGEDLLVATRYLTARYGSYPIVWITGQEIDVALELWKKSAEIVDELDGYNHPQGTHMLPGDATFSAKNDLNNQEWHEWWATQGGHSRIPSKAQYKSYWDTKKLFLETELNYEDITCGGFNGYELSRIGAWKANLCGSYGFTYGVTGVWANCYSTAGNTGWLGSYSFEPWYMGLNKAGSYEMTYLKNFFEYAEFYTLIPRYNDTAYSNFTSEDKLVSSNDDGSTYVGYFYNSNTTTGEFRGLDVDVTYTARWYNPLTGKFIDIENVEITAEGTYVIPEKPTTGDWTILVTSKDLGEYATEEAYQDITDAKALNFALDADAKCSTYNTNGGTAWKEDLSNDGDKDSYWCAKGRNENDWIAYNLGSQKTFNQIEMLLHDEGNFGFEIYGANGAEAWATAGGTEGWTLIKDVTLTADVDKKVSSTFEEVTYQYVKIVYTDLPRTHWAALHQINVCKAENNIQQESLPTFKGEVQTPSVKTVAGAIYDADGNLADTKANLVDKDFATEWKTFGPIGTQTIIMDLEKEMNLSGIVVTLGQGAYLPEYRVEVSNDGSDWTILADATLRDTQSVTVDGLEKMYEELYGKYRYVKLFWLNAPNNSTTKTIAEIEVYAYDDADKSALADTIAEAEKINLDNYKDEGKDAFKTALADAKAVYAETAPTQEEVDAAKDALINAMEGLKKKVFNPLKPENQENSGEKDKSENSDKKEESGKPEYYPVNSSSTTASSTAQTGAGSKTGDSNQTALVVALLLFAVAGFVGVYTVRKRTNQK